MQLEFPQLPMIKFPFSNDLIAFLLNTPALLIILTIFFIFYVVVSGVLVYHWNAYGMRSGGILIAKTFYIFVSVVLFIIAGLALYYF